MLIDNQNFTKNLMVLFDMHFTQEEIVELLHKNPEFMVLKPGDLKHNFWIPDFKLKIPSEYYRKVMLKHPDLLFLCSVQLQTTKYKLLTEKYKFKE